MCGDLTFIGCFSALAFSVFNELGPSTPTSMHVLTKVMRQKCKEREADPIMTIVFLGAEERPTIHFVPPSTTTLPDIFKSAFAHPFEEMYPYFVSTGGYINKEASDIASSSSDDGGASNRALFYSGVEVAASLSDLEYPPSAPTNRELAATAATLRSPGVLQAFGIRQDVRSVFILWHRRHAFAEFPHQSNRVPLILAFPLIVGFVHCNLLQGWETSISEAMFAIRISLVDHGRKNVLRAVSFRKQSFAVLLQLLGQSSALDAIVMVLLAGTIVGMAYFHRRLSCLLRGDVGQEVDDAH